MIPRKLTAAELVGKQARTLRPIQSGAGVWIGQGRTVTITDVSKGSGLTVGTLPCSCCGLSLVAHVRREDLDLYSISRETVRRALAFLKS